MAQRIDRCTTCGVAWTADAFYPSRPSQCKACARQAASERRDPERQRAWQLDRMYGITPAQYDELLAEQGGGCAICHQPCPTGMRLAVDHCHSTGEVRGLLCANHNRGLGMFQDDVAMLKAAIAYLEK